MSEVDETSFQHRWIASQSKYEVKWIDLDLTDDNPFWHRKVYDEKSIAELKMSLRQHGQLELPTVRPKGERYQLAKGHRRLRAIKAAGIPKMLAIERNLSDAEMLEHAVVENLQKEDVNPMDEAEGYKQMQDQLSYTQEVIGMRVGKSRERISHLLSLLKSDPELQDDVRRRTLTPDHVEAIMRIPDKEKRMEVRQKVIQNKKSVKATRRLVNKILNPPEEPFVKRKFDVWNIASVDLKKPFGDPDYPGAIPGDVVANVLMWFLPDGGKVIDPMAGGGVTEDVCKALSANYDVLLYDNKSLKNYEYRESIKKFNDIQKGELPREAYGANLIFVDPPYGPLKEYGLEPEELESLLKGLAEASYAVLEPDGIVALLMQNYYAEGECLGDFVPLIRETAEIFESLGFKQVFEATVPLHGKVARSEVHMTHIDRRLLVFQKLVGVEVDKRVR